jgi:hypothetical protein
VLDKGFMNVQLYASRSIGGDDLIGKLDSPIEIATLMNGINGA